MNHSEYHERRPTSVRILIADEHTQFRKCVRETLTGQDDFQVIGETGSARDAVGMATSCRPEIAVVAVGGRALDGLDLTERLSEAAPETAVIVISIHSDERYVQRALEVGAHAYVTKDEIADFLIPEIRAAHEAMMCRSRHSEA